MGEADRYYAALCPGSLPKALCAMTQAGWLAAYSWAWPQGCIEQEQRLRDMSAAEIKQQMPAFKACFDWIRSF